MFTDVTSEQVRINVLRISRPFVNRKFLLEFPFEDELQPAIKNLLGNRSTFKQLTSEQLRPL